MRRRSARDNSEPLIFESVVMISSWIPWAKKAFSLSELKFSKGRTATDLLFDPTGATAATLCCWENETSAVQLRSLRRQ